MALVPPAVVTVMSTTPAEPAGDVAVIEVALLTEKDDALVLPNLTSVAPVKFVPVIVTLLPPAVEPDDGEMDVTAGTTLVTLMVTVIGWPNTSYQITLFVPIYPEVEGV